MPTKAVELSAALASALARDRVDPLANVAGTNDRVVVFHIESQPQTAG